MNAFQNWLTHCQFIPLLPFVVLNSFHLTFTSSFQLSPFPSLAPCLRSVCPASVSLQAYLALERTQFTNVHSKEKGLPLT